MSTPSDTYRDPRSIARLARRLRECAPARRLTFMHVCGTHEHAIARAGLRSLLPDTIRVIAGPGCPVCVCPLEEIDTAARIAVEEGAVVASYGDMLRVPGTYSLAEARARGGDVRVISSASMAVEMARAMPERQVVLFAVGFETTACTTAAAVLSQPPENFSVLVAHRLIPPALEALAAMKDLDLDGFLLPGHVLTVTGPEPYERFAQLARRPCAVAGFEPLDVLLGLESLTRLAAEPGTAVSGAPSVGHGPADADDPAANGRAGLVNAYPRAVRRGGNSRALEMMERAFVPIDAHWRGLGVIPESGLALSPAFAHYDARRRFPNAVATESPAGDAPECLCGRVMIGRAEPESCRLFGTGCTPEAPCGPCMVSAEGTCRSRFLYPEARTSRGSAAGAGQVTS